MLRSERAYTAARLVDKPVWHWSRLFSGPEFIGATDIDLYAEYKGHGIVIESKPFGVMPRGLQAKLLESMAAHDRMYVILCGTEGQRVVCWVDVTADGSWRSPSRVQYGDDDAFKRKVTELKRIIDVRCAPANDPVFDTRSYRQIPLL